MRSHASIQPRTSNHDRHNNILRIGLAQIDCRLGDVERNAERHLDWIAQAREAGVDLLVFPELSLTGYRLLHLTPRVALPAGSPVLTRLAEAAGPMRVVRRLRRGGGARRAAQQRRPARRTASPSIVHRKLYLPTYGIFQEERFFGAGRRLEPASLPGGNGRRADLRGPLAPRAGPAAWRWRAPSC